MEIEVTSDMRKSAQDLHRRRMLANTSGVSLRFETSLAEIAALRAFDRDAQMMDLKVAAKSLQFVPKDLSGRDVRVIYRERWPIRVYSYRLDQADVFLFVVKVNEDTLDVTGWLPLAQVERAPIYWWEEDGERVDYAHEIDNGHQYPLPDTFDFVDACGYGHDVHDDLKFSGVWNDAMMAWECFGCGSFIYEDELRESIIASGRSEVPPFT